MFILVMIFQKSLVCYLLKGQLGELPLTNYFWHQEEVPVGNKFKNTK